MKKIISNPIFTFILGALICGTTGVVASTLMASNIAYTPKDSSWGVNNVEAAIDSLKISKTSDNYSTDEKVVGTWIDGKPLYQKTIIVTNQSKYTTNYAYSETIIVDNNIDTLVKNDGVVELNYGDHIKHSLPWYQTWTENNNIVNCLLEWNNTNKTLYIKTRLQNGIWYDINELKFIVNIKYTKTTD